MKLGMKMWGVFSKGAGPDAPPVAMFYTEADAWQWALDKERPWSRSSLVSGDMFIWRVELLDYLVPK